MLAEPCNKNASMLLIKYSFMIAGLLLASCAQIPTEPRPSDNIKFDDLATGHLVFGGITSSIDNWSYEQRIAYSKLARDEIASQRKTLSIKTTDWLVEKIGEQDVLLIHEILKMKMLLDVDLLQKIKDQLNDVRYLVLARVDADSASQSSSQHTETYKKKSQEYSTYTTMRTMTISLEIYDLGESTRAWSGAFSVRDVNENENPHTSSKSPLKDLANGVLEDIMFGTHPKPTSTKNMIQIAFAKIGNVLPAPKCSDVWRPECPDIRD